MEIVNGSGYYIYEYGPGLYELHLRVRSREGCSWKRVLELTKELRREKGWKIKEGDFVGIGEDVFGGKLRPTVIYSIER